MKRTLSSLFGIAILTLLLASCKENENTVSPTTPVYKAGANDESARNEADKSYDQAMDLFRDHADSVLGGGRTGAKVLPCGVFKIDTTAKGILVVYDSTKNCATKVLSGTISMTLISGKTFKDTGAVLEIEYKNYKVFYQANQQSLTYNGKLNVTNTTGGLFADLPTRGMVSRSVRGNLNVTFEDEKKTTRSWRITKKRVFKQSNSADLTTISFQLEADSANVVESGLTKDGQNFVTEVNIPLKWENCGTDFTGPYVLKYGSWKWVVNGSNSLEAQAGYTFTNGSASEVNDCNSNGYKLIYNINGNTATEFQYY